MTLLVLVYLIAIILALVTFRVLIVIVYPIVFFIALAVGSAIYIDLFGLSAAFMMKPIVMETLNGHHLPIPMFAFLTDLRWWLLCGLASLGSIPIVSALVALITSDTDYFTGSGALKALANIASFLGSVSTLIKFYQDHLQVK